jgi:hypothetical protein
VPSYTKSFPSSTITVPAPTNLLLVKQVFEIDSLAPAAIETAKPFALEKSTCKNGVLNG